jgi:multimeric flavodoxin WrbA
MKVVIFNGSPRKKGNTSALVDVMSERLISRGAEVDDVMLFVKNILGCNNCRACQNERLPLHCSINDDMIGLYDKFLSADVIVIATPIYMWQFTPCTLAFLTRLHCLCKSSDFSYNDMKGKKIALALTMGDNVEVAEPAVSGLRQFCGYYSAEYLGALMVPFADREKILAGSYSKEISDFVDKIIVG